MEPPVRSDRESMRDEKVKVLKAIPPIDEKNWSADSSEAIGRNPAWLRTPEWKPLPPYGCPLFPGAGTGSLFISGPGKCLAVTCTKMIAACANPQQFTALRSETQLLSAQDQPRHLLEFGLNYAPPDNRSPASPLEMLLAAVIQVQGDGSNERCSLTP